MIYFSKGSEETKRLANFLIKKFLKKHRKTATVVALEGELGAGKTVFVKGVARALGVKSKIKSPTFTLIKSYKLKSKKHKLLYHLDCYRLRNHKDLLVLGIKDVLKDKNNLLVVEWPERIKKILPKGHIKIKIDHVDKNTRKIRIDNLYSPPSLKLRKGTSSLKEEMLALRSSEGAKK